MTERPELEQLRHADYIWIAIRVFGLYLLIRALSSVVSLVSVLALLGFILVGRLLLSDGSPQPNWGLTSTYSEQAIALLLETVMYLLVGRYLVRDGRRLFSLVRPIAA
jgi:hypothetical protein